MEEPTTAATESATITRTVITIKEGVQTTNVYDITPEQQRAELPDAVHGKLGGSTGVVHPDTTWFRDDCIYSGWGFRIWDQLGFTGNELCIYDDGSGTPVHLASVARSFRWPNLKWNDHLNSWSTTELPYYYFVDFLQNGTQCDEEPAGYAWNSSSCQLHATDINLRYVIP